MCYKYDGRQVPDVPKLDHSLANQLREMRWIAHSLDSQWFIQLINQGLI